MTEFVAERRCCAVMGCGLETDLNEHHLMPQVLGGLDDDNLIILCRRHHGIAHGVEWRFGELVKAGRAKALARTAADWKAIAEDRAKQAEDASRRAGEIEDAQKAELLAARAADMAQEAERPPPAPWAVSKFRGVLERPAAEPSPRYVPAEITHVRPLRAAPSGPERFLQLRADKQFRVSGEWALASDGIQWIIQHKSGKQWFSSKFIRTTREWLAYRLRNTLKVPPEDADRLLDGLPDTFDEWRLANEAFFATAETKAA